MIRDFIGLTLFMLILIYGVPLMHLALTGEYLQF